jgi:hypothetical protein
MRTRSTPFRGLQGVRACIKQDTGTTPALPNKTLALLPRHYPRTAEQDTGTTPALPNKTLALLPRHYPRTAEQDIGTTPALPNKTLALPPLAANKTLAPPPRAAAAHRGYRTTAAARTRHWHYPR